MKAWEYEAFLRKNARPSEEITQGSWEDSADLWIFPEQVVKMFWQSKVPGSGAPECLIAGAIQSVENMGRNVEKAEDLFKIGLELYKNDKISELRAVTSLIFESLRNAPIISDHNYHCYSRPERWEDISCNFPKQSWALRGDIYDKILGGWIGQIAGSSMGTKFEGYSGSSLETTFGEGLGYYVGDVNTLNDDITYEIAFLMAANEDGELTSKKIATKWIEMIPFGWSAEYIALENLKMGIFPPESGIFNNPFQEWIGAQMRCMVHGLLMPGLPEKAAYLAYIDSCISHAGNGLYGGIHSAVLTSLAFTTDDIHRLIELSLEYVPRKSEFEEVLRSVVQWCKNSKSWRDVRNMIENRFVKYNWIHVYPNLCCVIAALWYGEGDFDRTMYIISALGYDVDCNAGEAGTVLGVLNGANMIPKKWTDPLENTLRTYIDGWKRTEITMLAEATLAISEKVKKKISIC